MSLNLSLQIRHRGKEADTHIEATTRIHTEAIFVQDTEVCHTMNLVLIKMLYAIIVEN